MLLGLTSGCGPLCVQLCAWGFQILPPKTCVAGGRYQRRKEATPPRRDVSSPHTAMAQRVDGESPSPAISVGDGEVLRLAVTLAAARGLLSPVDLAAVDVAARPALGHGARSLAESASESAVRASLPFLVDPAADPTAPPRGAESWSAVHRRCHRPDATLGMGAEMACRVDARGRLWTWGVDVGHGMLGDGGQSDEDDAPTARTASVAVNRFTDAPTATRTVRHAPRVVRFDSESAPRRGSSRGPVETKSFTHLRGDEGSDDPRATLFAPTSVRITGVSVGDGHVACVDDRGGLWTWGANRQGQLGRPSVGFVRHELTLESELEDAPADPRPTRVAGFGLDSRTLDSCDDSRDDGCVAFATSVSAGTWHTVVVDATGAAHAFGYNHSGQLGLPGSPAWTFGGGGGDQYVARTVWKRPQRLKHVWDLGVRFVSASAGKHRTVFLDVEGGVWTAFCNEMSVGRVASGGNLSGDDYEQSETEPWVRRLPPNPRRVKNAPKTVYLDMSHETALMVDTRGGVWAWGKGNEGQTGLGHTRTATSPAGPLRGALENVRVERVVAGDEHCLAIAADGSLYGFGRGDDGRLWGAMRNVRSPASLCAGRAFAAVACGSVVDAMGGSKGACVGVTKDDQRVTKDGGGTCYTWGSPRPWLGRGGSDADDAMWARSNDIGAVRFDESGDGGDGFR